MHLLNCCRILPNGWSLDFCLQPWYRWSFLMISSVHFMDMGWSRFLLFWRHQFRFIFVLPVPFPLQQCYSWKVFHPVLHWYSWWPDRLLMWQRWPFSEKPWGANRWLPIYRRSLAVLFFLVYLPTGWSLRNGYLERLPIFTGTVNMRWFPAGFSLVRR